MKHARFLVDVELNRPAVNCNPSFDASITKAKQARVVGALSELVVEVPKGTRGVREGSYIGVDDLNRNNRNGGADGGSDVCVRIHDVTKSYYEVAQSRFADNICAQAVDHFLLSAKGSPLRVFGSIFVLEMTNEDLEMTTGEEAASRNKRSMLKQRIELLEKAVKILRG